MQFSRSRLSTCLAEARFVFTILVNRTCYKMLGTSWSQENIKCIEVITGYTLGSHPWPRLVAKYPKCSSPSMFARRELVRWDEKWTSTHKRAYILTCTCIRATREHANARMRSGSPSASDRPQLHICIGNATTCNCALTRGVNSGGRFEDYHYTTTRWRRYARVTFSQKFILRVQSRHV